MLAVAGAALALAAYAAWPCRLPTPWPIEIVGGLCRTFPVRARPVTAGVGPLNAASRSPSVSTRTKRSVGSLCCTARD
jgi:hypothetical protein